MTTRRPNWRGVRRHRSYSVDEAARAVGVSKGTVRRWTKTGLPAITDRKPTLILGSDLITYIKSRRLPKQRCQPDECYCFSCRAPRRPAFNAVEYVPLMSTSGNLRALCTKCSTVMHKRVSMAGLAALEAILDMTITQADRPMIAFALLSGVRDDALASLSLRHVNLVRRQVFQDARTVRTKNRKTITSWFFPVGEDIEAIVADWIGHLVTELHYGPDDPLFPSTRMALDADSKFAPAGLERRHWKNADAIRRIFRQAFAAAGLPSFNPHSFRRTLALLGEIICKSPEAFKAWSQNLGHEHVLTTFTSYGAISSHRQADILQELRTARNGGETTDSDPDPAEAHRLLDQILKKASRG